MGSNAVQADGLCVDRGRKRVLHDLRFHVGRGEVVGLLGPSGCGKTTLMRAIVGVQAGVTGALEVLGPVTRSERSVAEETIRFSVPQKVRPSAQGMV